MFSFDPFNNNDTGLSIREKLNALGENSSALSEKVDEVSADLVTEIALRSDQVSTLTAALAAETDNRLAVEAQKADLVTGKVPLHQLPSYVSAVENYPTFVDFPASGDPLVIYVANDTADSYRWSGAGYFQISGALTLGETSATAYRGDRGKIAYDHSQLTASNPHNVTLTMLGAGNSSTRNVGTTAGTVAAGDDSRITGAAQKASNLSDLASAATARTNLGLGAVATENVNPLAKGGTGATTAADARTNLGLGQAAQQTLTYFLRSDQNLGDIPNKAAALFTLGFNSDTSPGTSGHFTLPILVGGLATKLYIQWMRVTVAADNEGVFDWPTPFPSVCLPPICCRADAFNIGSDAGVSARDENVNSVRIRNGAGATGVITVWGFGY